jgi:hypothetical protein
MSLLGQESEQAITLIGDWTGEQGHTRTLDPHTTGEQARPTAGNAS